MSIFSKIKKDDFIELLNHCSNYIEIDIDKAYNAAINHIKNHKDNNNRLDNSYNVVKLLENKWYESLKGDPDYSVYSDPYYICDIWACWVLYSRKSLLSLKSEKSLDSGSVLDYIGSTKQVVDVGCGFGFTTAGLKELFPSATVYGTNLKESYQYKVANKYGKEYDFKVVENINKLKQVDVIFASEYFEHFINPIEHAYELLSNSKPRFVITANGFNGVAIGHFHKYVHQGNWYGASTMSRMFNQAMRMMGYSKLKTNIWNGRPAIWERVK